MVITRISLIPMDRVEKHPPAKQTDPRSQKATHGDNGLVVFRSCRGWEMSQARFCSWGSVKLALLMKMISNDFPKFRKPPPSLLISSSHALSATWQVIFATLAGGVWGPMGTVKGQEGFSKEREVQEVVLGHKIRFSGGNSVQAPPNKMRSTHQSPSVHPVLHVSRPYSRLTHSGGPRLAPMRPQDAPGQHPQGS